MIAGCTDSGPDAAATPSPTSPSASTPTEKPLTPRQRLRQLAALAPQAFDASYHLQGRGPRPDAAVRMRTKGDHFRLDVRQGHSTAVLVNVHRGVVSCQVVDKKKGHSDKTCFLVSHKPKGLPDLFDPEVQRLFRSTTRYLSGKDQGAVIKKDGKWRAPHHLGVAECYKVKGKNVDTGTYCYIATPGPHIGLLARADFPSGTLEIRDVKRVLNKHLFKPPVHPTPLPTQG